MHRTGVSNRTGFGGLTTWSRVALAAHDKVLRSVIEAHNGFVFSHTGDGMAAAFTSPTGRSSRNWGHVYESAIRR
jgi:class 3 adenylate cyclase